MSATRPVCGQGSANAPGRDLLRSGPARALSFLLASAFCGALVLFPQWVIRGGEPPSHGLLLMGMVGMAAGFVHGVGFVPHRPVFQLLLGPFSAWLLLPLATWLMLAAGA